ncbi:MAG: hypothetical protein PHT69_14090 [Bacteroidales bacterium]|nr:hypothetical protein [Bacteroidales bacterium]
MIKKIFLAVFVLSLWACGPTKEELEEQQRLDDSIMDIERLSIIEKANQLMEESSQIDTMAVVDSTEIQPR